MQQAMQAESGVTDLTSEAVRDATLPEPWTSNFVN